MSLHIGANRGEVADTVLICGDPLRARHIAQNGLSDCHCYSEVRGMLGFTGTYQGKQISVQGTGMGIPSTAIYVHELIHEYDVRRIIRIGTCGAIQPELDLGELIIATSAYTDSCAYRMPESASRPDTQLVTIAESIAAKLSVAVRSGPVFSTDMFYDETGAERWKPWTARGVLAVEMETSLLYTLAARNTVQALTILTVSDNILTKKYFSAQERERASTQIMKLALGIAND